MYATQNKTNMHGEQYHIIYWNCSELEQNDKVHFQRSTWHPTKAHCITHNSTAGAGSTVKSHCI